jgi:hypothetical protein
MHPEINLGLPFTTVNTALSTLAEPAGHAHEAFVVVEHPEATPLYNVFSQSALVLHNEQGALPVALNASELHVYEHDIEPFPHVFDGVA